MAPEVHCGAAYNAKADVYSLGIMLYELFSGVSLSARFTSAAELQAFAANAAAGQRPVLPTRFPPTLQRIIRQAWAHEPSDRPTSAELLAMLRALEASAEFEDYAGGSRKWPRFASCFACAAPPSVAP